MVAAVAAAIAADAASVGHQSTPPITIDQQQTGAIF